MPASKTKVSSRKPKSPRKNSPQQARSHEKSLDKRFYQDKGSRYQRSKLMCRYCKAIYDGKSWKAFEKLDPHMIDELKMSICPACHEQFDHVSDGVLHLHGSAIKDHKHEILNLIDNIAEREEGRDILNRIERIEEDRTGIMTIYTTKNQLAVELGKHIANAYKGGKLDITWSKDDKPVEVHWYYEGKKEKTGSKKKGKK